MYHVFSVRVQRVAQRNLHFLFLGTYIKSTNTLKRVKYNKNHDKKETCNIKSVIIYERGKNSSKICNTASHLAYKFICILQVRRLLRYE